MEDTLYTGTCMFAKEHKISMVGRCFLCEKDAHIADLERKLEKAMASSDAYQRVVIALCGDNKTMKMAHDAYEEYFKEEIARQAYVKELSS